jgi:superfamily I DNA and/or RNA helicase
MSNYNADSANDKVKSGKLKEWDYVCNDHLRQEAHSALKQEFKAAVEHARSEKLTLEEGRFIRKIGESFCYRFNVSQLIIKSLQADRPHRIEIGQKHVDGSIVTAGDGKIELELSSNYGDILHRADIIFDLSVLLDLVDRRLVDIDKDPKAWNASLATELFSNLNVHSSSQIISKCDHQNRLDKKPLKNDQQRVVKHLLDNPLTIIWGPPGTGKSHTLLAGLAEYIANNKTIVFASNTNSAIDNVLEKIIGDDCPYPELADCRDKGLIVRLGSQSSSQVKSVFSPKAIARLKSKEINDKLNQLQKSLREVQKQAESTRQKIATWNQHQETIKRHEMAVSQLKNLPTDSELNDQISTCQDSLKNYTAAYSIIFPVLKKISDEIPGLSESIVNCKSTIDAASALIQERKSKKTELLDELSPIKNSINDIESSRIKKWIKGKDLDELKRKSSELLGEIDKIDVQIESAQNSLNKATNEELEYISKAQLTIKYVSRNSDDLINLYKVILSLAPSLCINDNDTQLIECLKILSKFAQGNNHVQIIKALGELAVKGLLNTRKKDLVSEKIRQRINSLESTKKTVGDLINKINITKRDADKSRIYIKTNADDYNTWQFLIESLEVKIKEFKDEIVQYEKQLEELEQSIVKDAKLLCLTMVKASYDRLFLNNRYDVLVIDEYSMVSLPQLYCTAALAKERVVLCGDHLQLPPICQSEEEFAQKWMGQSIYEWHEGKHEERLKRVPPGPTKLRPHLAILTDQHRMPPEISYLIRPWYQKEGNSLNDDWNQKADAYIKNNSNHVLLDKNITILDTTESNCYSAKSAMKGRYNLVHAAIIAFLCKEFTTNHEIDPEKIICLTPYRQQSILTQTLFNQISPDIAPTMEGNTWTIHKSQGRGEPIVIYDLTDGKESSLSFFHKSSDPNLLNVALSRSKARIIIVCSLKKMIQGLNTATESPLRSVFQRMAELCVPVYNAKAYYDTIFKSIDIQSIFSGAAVGLTEAQKNGILVLTSSEYYHALAHDISNATKSITIVSPFITIDRFNRLEPLLVQAIERTNGKILIEIITRPPERMFDRYKDDFKRSACIGKLLDRLDDFGIKITLALNTHEKLVIIDEKISYWGSLNPLSFKDTDEINTRLEAEGLANKLLDFAVHGQSKPYRRMDEQFTEDDLKNSLIEIATKELRDLAWTLAGYYGRPRYALMYKMTIESLVSDPPKTVDEYYDIHELSKAHSVLRNHLPEIENIIYPIRGFKLGIEKDKPNDNTYSQLNLFPNNTSEDRNKDVLRADNCKCITLDKYWKFGDNPDGKILGVKDFKQPIIEVLESKQGKTCKKAILPDEVLKHMKIITRGAPRKKLIQKIKQAIKNMVGQGTLIEYVTAAGVNRVKLKI